MQSSSAEMLNLNPNRPHPCKDAVSSHDACRTRFLTLVHLELLPEVTAVAEWMC